MSPDLTVYKFISLDRFVDPDTHILSGRDTGRKAREEVELNEIDQYLKDHPDEQVTIEIPDSVIAVTSSFAIGMFAETIRHLGGDRFREQYVFEGPVTRSTITGAIHEVQLRQEVKQAEFA